MDPQAFPKTVERWDAGQDRFSVGSEDGMSLRDYFAAAAMQGASGNPAILEMFQVHGRPGQVLADWVAPAAYVMADAMLKARESAS